MVIDTNGKSSIEAGIYKLKITAYPQVVKAGDYDKYEFQFTIDGSDKPMKQSFFPNQMKGLLLAVGMKEVSKGVFDGDINDAYGKNVEAELFFEEFTKKDGTTGKARRLKDFKACKQDQVVTKPEVIEWEE